MTRTRAFVFAILALTVLVFAYMFQNPALPHPLPADAAAHAFSGHRALAHIRQIAGEPRPTGSPGLARARTYLIDALKTASPRFRIEIQESLVVESFLPGIANATRVKNIVARLPGTDSTRPLLLLAHYDSVVNAPGANDDGAGVGTVLELVRAMASRGRYRNDIVVLFTDGEERGMLGARGYYRDSKRGREEVIAFNFEARGNSGLALLFQTGPSSSWLVREFARLAPTPAASSVSQELFRILPYGTDFSVFAKNGMPGLNFAYIKNTIYYHSAFDTPDSVDVRSLQHHGDNALELLVHLAGRDLSLLPGQSPSGESETKDAADETPARTSPAVFFLAGNDLLVYSSDWNRWLLAFVWLIYLAGFAGEFRWGRLRGILLQFFAPLLVGIAGALAVFAIWHGLILNLYPDFAAILPTGETYRAGYFKAGLQCAGLFFALWFYISVFARNSRSPAVVCTGGLGFWLVSATLCTAYAPGAAYVFLWPLVVYLPMCVAVRMQRGDGPLMESDLPGLLLGLPVLAMLFAPIIRFLFFGLLTTTAQPFAMLIYGPWLFFLVLPLVANQARTLRRTIYSLLAIASVSFLIGGAQVAAFGEGQPRPNSLFYIFDVRDNRLARFSCDARLDDWTRGLLAQPGSAMIQKDRQPGLAEFLPILHACLPGLNRPVSAILDGQVWQAAGVRGPLAALVRDQRRPNGDRDLTIRVQSRRAAPQVYAFLKFAGEIQDLTVDGVAVPAAKLRLPGGSGRRSFLGRLGRRVFGSSFDLGGWSGLLLASSGKSEFLISFTATSSQPTDKIEVKLVDHTNGLPEITSDIQEHERGPDSVPGGRYPFSDGVFVVNGFLF